MEEHRGQFSVTAMARVLEGSTSGYYGWRRRRECRRSRENRRLLVEIKAIHAESDATYGSPRIHRELQARGIRGGENRVARRIRLHQVRPKQRRRYKWATDLRHDLPVAENHLDRQFNPEAPNGAWAADITFVWTREGWLYLAVVMDLFSRRTAQKLLCGLVDAVPLAAEAGDRRVENGHGEPARRQQLALPQRSRQPVCEWRLPRSTCRGTSRMQHELMQHEPKGRLLGQCAGGKLHHRH